MRFNFVCYKQGFEWQELLMIYTGNNEQKEMALGDT